MEGMQGKVGHIREGYHTPKEGGCEPVLVAEVTSTGQASDQYWLLFRLRRLLRKSTIRSASRES